MPEPGSAYSEAASLQWADMTAPDEDISMTRSHDPPTQLTRSNGPKIKTLCPVQRQARARNDQKYISPSYTRSIRWCKSGRGIVITDVDGNEFYDFSAGIAVTSTALPSEWCRYAETGGRTDPHVGHDFYYENMVTLAERLSKIAPCPDAQNLLR